METEEKYRPNVAVLLTDGHGRVLLCERVETDYEAAVQIVQGGIDEGESVIDAALRETSEELGIDPSIVTILGVMEEKFRYTWDPEHIAKWGIAFPIRAAAEHFVGQEQQYVCVQIEPGTPMNLDAHQREFSRVRWGSPQELIEGCWERKRPGIIAALQYFELLDVKFSA